MKRPSPRSEVVIHTREKYGFTQAVAADIIGVNVSTWAHYEHGRRRMPWAVWRYFRIAAPLVAAKSRGTR